MAAVAAASAELLIIGWYIFRVLLQWVSHRRCSDTPCRSWRTRCPGPGGRCWGSAGREPPTEAPAPSPGRPYHHVLLRISASMGASAAQAWGVPCVPSPEEHLPRSVRG
uniref:Neuronatin n=1 Tax=Chinchilla lanigera TaxID=34839 RepID=A0A8C2VQ20_CHILA